MSIKKIILFFLVFLNSLTFSKESKIILIGDTQRTLWFELFREQNEEIRQIIFPQIASENPDRIILLGDMTNWGASSLEWNYFDKIFDTIYKLNIPVYPVLGNHDYYGSNQSALDNIYQRFPFFKNTTWYSREFQNLKIIALNSNLEELNSDERKSQIEFLIAELNKAENNKEINHIICVWHHPPFTNSSIISDDEDVKKEFLEIIQKHNKVKLIASGHCHSYEHFLIDKKHYLVSGGGGGPRQKLNKNLRHQDLFDAEDIRQFHYSILTIQDKNIEVKIIGFDEKSKEWNTIDNWIIN